MKKKVGRFGDFGGQYVPETVMNAVHELEQAYDFYKNDPQFQKELTDLYHNYALLCGKDDQRFRRSQNLYQTGRFESYRFP